MEGKYVLYFFDIWGDHLVGQLPSYKWELPLGRDWLSKCGIYICLPSFSNNKLQIDFATFDQKEKE